VISRVNQRNGFGYPALDFLCGSEGAENKFEVYFFSSVSSKDYFLFISIRL
jgi:hypothetical protein